MKKLLLIEEINRTKKLMLLEGPGSGIRTMFVQYGMTWAQKNKICDDLLDAGVDDSVVNNLRLKRDVDEFTDELHNQLDTLSKGSDLGESSQLHRVLKGLSKSIGLNTKLDDVLRILKDDTKTDVEKATAKTVFLANFRDAEIQDFFKKNIDQIDSDNTIKQVDKTTLKGKIEDELGNITMNKKTLDSMLEGLPLSKFEKSMITKGKIYSALAQDLYNFSKQLEQVTLGKGVRIMNEQEKLINSVYNRLVNVINKLDNNKNFEDAEKQFAIVWNEINNMRLLFRRTSDGGQITKGDPQWNSDLFLTFVKTLENQKVPYQTTNKLKTYWENASPMTRKTWLDMFKETRFGQMLYNPKSNTAKFLTDFAATLTKPIFGILNWVLDFLISGNFSFKRKEFSELIYRNGILIPKGWKKIKGKKIIPRLEGQWLNYSKQSLTSAYLIIPLIVNFITGIYNLGVSIFRTKSDENTLENESWNILLSPITYINRQMEEGGVFGLIKDVVTKILLPFNPLIDDLWREIWAILTEAKEITVDNYEGFSKSVISFTKRTWIKIRDFYDRLKTNTENEIDDIRNRDNPPQDSTTTPVYQDTIIPDTSGGGFVEG